MNFSSLYMRSTIHKACQSVLTNKFFSVRSGTRDSFGKAQLRIRIRLRIRERQTSSVNSKIRGLSEIIGDEIYRRKSPFKSSSGNRIQDRSLLELGAAQNPLSDVHVERILAF